MVMDTAEIKISNSNLIKLNKIEKIMKKEGMAEQNYNFIIGRVFDFYLNRNRVKND